VIATLGGTIANWLERIPFSGRLGDALRWFSSRAASLHRFAPLVVALILGYLTVLVVLWVAKQPLFFLWPIFGSVSGNDPRSLFYYNAFSHLLAFAVASKVVFETLKESGG
jgi:hypothetical protein